MSNKLIKSTNDFYQHLAFRESSNNPSCVSVRGYLGLYQMGEMALDDAGYYNSRDGTKKNDWIGKWRNKDHVNSKADFLNNPYIQTKACIEFHKIIWQKYLKNYHHLEGGVIKGHVLTKSGMIAATHLVGIGSFKNFLDSEGKVVPSDANYVKCSDWLDEFAGYDIDFGLTSLLGQSV